MPVSASRRVSDSPFATPIDGWMDRWCSSAKHYVIQYLDLIPRTLTSFSVKMAAVEIKILNSGKLDSKMSASALELSLELQKLMMQMKSGFMSEDGRGVDYKALTTSEVFQKYVTKTRQLQDVKLATLEKEEKIAFFLNILFNSA